MSIIQVTDNDFEEKVVKSTLPILLDFAAAWCQPCKMAEPVLEELSNIYNEKIVIAKLDVDQNPQVSQRFGVMSIPTTILFKNGNEIGRQIGFSGKQAFEDLIKKGIS